MRWCFISRCCAALVRFAAPFDMLTRGGGGGGDCKFYAKDKKIQKVYKELFASGGSRQHRQLREIQCQQAVRARASAIPDSAWASGSLCLGP